MVETPLSALHQQHSARGIGRPLAAGLRGCATGWYPAVLIALLVIDSQVGDRSRNLPDVD
jgi:hypothetical protein